MEAHAKARSAGAGYAQHGHHEELGFLRSTLSTDHKTIGIQTGTG